MTDHTSLKMHREKVRVSDKKMLCGRKPAVWHCMMSRILISCR